MYSDYKVYGPYTRKDNRMFVVLYRNRIKRTLSYPRYLMEKSIGRFLLPTEDVHHKDENPQNNELENLTVIDRKEHCREHSLKYRGSVSKCCQWCGKKILLTPAQQRKRVSNGGKGPFCSRICSGKYGKSIQMGTFV